MQRVKLTLCEDNKGAGDFVYRVKTAIEYQAEAIDAMEIEALFAIFITNVKHNEAESYGS